MPDKPLCNESSCPSCGAQCQRREAHSGQHDCINCGTKWWNDDSEADTGPPWAIEVGFLFLTIDINRYVDSRTPATAPTATERVIAAAQQKRQRAGYPVCRFMAGKLSRI